MLFCRNTVHVAQRKQRQTILPPVLERRPSVMYDKIVYRYISDTHEQSYVPPTSNHLSLPRGASMSRPTSCVPQQQQHQHSWSNPPIIEYDTSPHYGQSIWANKSDTPIIVNDDNMTDDMSMNVATSVVSTAGTSSAAGLRRAASSAACLPRSIFPVTDHSKTYTDSIPIYENSELYGPSRPPTEVIVPAAQAPLYENLPFHRRINIRQRPRRLTLNAGSTYAAYREAKRKDSLLTQQNLVAKLTQGQGQTVLHSETDSSSTAAKQQQQQQQTYNQPFHETCYFV